MATDALTAVLRETMAVFEGSGEPRTTTEIAEQLDLGRRSTYERLQRLVEHDRLDTKKVGAGGRVWWLPTAPDGASAERGAAEGGDVVELGDRELTRQVLKTTPASIFVLDREGDIVMGNERFRERIRSVQASEAFNVADIEMYDAAGDHIPPDERPHATVFRTGDALTGWDCQVALASGHRRWVSLNAAPLTDGEGGVEAVVVAVEDTTSQRSRTERLERQRDELETELDDVFQRVDDGLVAMDETATVTYLNDRAEEQFGVVGAECIGSPLADAVPALDDTQFDDRMRQTLRSQESTTFELPLDAREAHLELTVYPSETGVSVYVRDVSERRQRERALERHRAIVETMGDGVYTVGADGRFSFVNEQYAEQMGMAPEELVGEQVTDIVSARLAAQANALEQELIDGERDVAKLQATFEGDDGTPRTMEATFAIMWLGEESYERVSVVRDITEHVRRERALEQSNRQLETLVENFPNGAVAFVDEDLQYATVGGTPLEDTGVTTAELQGERIADVVPAAVADVLVPRYEAALEGEPQSFEREHGGQARQFHIVPVRDGDGAVFGAIGMSQDITERKQYERGLEQRIRQLETITDLGTRALQDRDLDTLMAEVVEQTAAVLGVEYCKVLDLTPETDELLLRQGVGWDDGIVGSATVSAVEDDSQAAYTLKVDHPVVVADLDTESRFSGPDLLRDHDVRSGISVIIGPYDDPWGILGTHHTDERKFTDQDINFVQSVANILANAIERASAERELVTQREQLATLNSLNGIVHGITDAVIERSTREEIEATVCEHLVETGSYSGAWIADGGDVTGPATVRASAGTATPRAADEGGPDDIEEGPNAIPDAASSISIPIGHEGMRYGVLHVHSERGSAFDRDEATVLGRLGEVVGHAIAASERKHALMSERVVEVHYRIDDVLAPFDIEDGGGHITFDQGIDDGDGEFLLYGTATAASIPTLESLVSAVSHWRELSVRESDGEATFELRVSEPPVLSVVASMGGSIESAVIDGGSFDMTVHVTPGTDVRTLTETVRDTYPDARLVSRRQRPRPDETLGALERVLDTDLTDRQRLVLTAAYHGGYFEWPRETSGDEIADSLGVSAPTFHQHLRKVEGRLFEALLSSSPVTS